MDSVLLTQGSGHVSDLWTSMKEIKPFSSDPISVAQPLQYRVGVNGIGVTTAVRAFLRTSTASAVPFL